MPKPSGSRYGGLLSELRLYFCNQIISHIPSHWIRSWYYKSIMKFDFAPFVSLLMGVKIDTKGQLSIGTYSTVNQNCRLDNRGGIKIGNHVSISAETIILTAGHDVQSKVFKGFTKKVTIEDFAFIGTRAMILPGVNIGKGAVVAAGAVVSKDVEPYTIVAGVPAKIIGRRNEELEYYPFYSRLLH